MLTWLTKIDPNTVVTLVVALAGFLWHQFASPTAQAKAQAAWQSALDAAGKIMDQLVAVAPKGTTKTELASMLTEAAKVQLAHVGLDPKRLPPAVGAALDALVAKVMGGDAATLLLSAAKSGS